jgi:hypothetical protein
VASATTISTRVVGIITLNNQITYILVSYFWISTIATSDTLGEVEVIQV